MSNLRHDLPASVVVFLVALPLCLGIALASGAPLLSGVITGIVGGVIVSWISGSPLSVSGPAAGLAVIVSEAIHEIGWESFLLAVVISGVMQFGLGLIRAGIVAYYFPNTVIKGLLAAIGLILVLKQIPHAIGFDEDYEGDFSFLQPDGRNTFTEIGAALNHINGGAVIIAMVGLMILVLLEVKPQLKRKWLPGPLLVVAMGVLINAVLARVAPSLVNAGDLLVSLPTMSQGGLVNALSFPRVSALTQPAIYRVAATLAVVASIETLLCVEAIDKQDPFKRESDANKELRAQGIGNVLSGLVGGLPMTAVIVRGSANVQAGGRTPMASFGHGVLLLVSVVAFPFVLNQIPLAALAAVLLHVGYKLAPPKLFVDMYRRGFNEFLPFVFTVVAILLTDLLIGVAVGMGIGVFFILRANLATPYFMHRREIHVEEGPGGRRTHIDIQLSENVTFLNKASVNRVLHSVPDDAVLTIDGSHAIYIDRDVLEIIHDFVESAHYRGIDVSLHDIPRADAGGRELLMRRKIDAADGSSLITSSRRHQA